VKPIATEQKLRGGYYTPDAIGKFLAMWAIRSPEDEILEPSCGDGVLVRAAARVLLAKGASPRAVASQLHAVELEANEAEKARTSLRAMGVPARAPLIGTGDFFQYAATLLQEPYGTSVAERPKKRFGVVIGNPPFVRYQNFLEVHRQMAFRLMNEMGLHPNRLTNAWVPFVCISAMLLKSEGRLAMVLPAELMQVTYTAELRQFLSDHFCRLMIVTFRELVFPRIQQEVVLLCAEKNAGTRTGIHVVELDGVEDLSSHTDVATDIRSFKPMDHSTEKWTQYFLTKREIGLIRSLRQHDKLQKLGDLASVDVGVVTGINEYFVLSQQRRKSAKLNGYTRRIVVRSGHLRGIRFTEEDWRTLASESQPTHLLDLPPKPLAGLPKSLQAYVRDGEEHDFHKGYKCRIRKLWYIIPSVWNPDAFLLRQIHRYPKLVVNDAAATCTDTIHRVKLLNGADGPKLAAVMLNSVTFAFAEIVGRSYGGGVLELEPRESERLPVPYGGADRIDGDELHRLLLADDLNAVLDITDRAVLQDWLGLAPQEAKAVRSIWTKLRDRRLNRKFRKAPSG
jgi:adenine-specific DNA-methyltransferase